MNTQLKSNDRPPLRLIRCGERANEQPQEVRFAPRVQVLNEAESHLEDRLQDVARAAFERGLDNHAICAEVLRHAEALDYDATIGVQEVRSDEMPSFEGRLVVSTVMLIDLQPRATILRLWRDTMPAQG